MDKICGRKSKNQQFAQLIFFVEKKCPNFQKSEKSFPHPKMWKIGENPTYQRSYPLDPHKKTGIFTVYIVFFETSVLCIFDKLHKCGYLF